MNVGFTGTRAGMTAKQKKTVAHLLQKIVAEYDNVHAHHGDCVGADSEFHYMCLNLDIPMTHYPCTLKSQRVHLPGAVEIRPPRAPLDRNKDIVRASNLVIATPKEKDEILRSGTWSTIRFAAKSGVPVILVSPDGLSKVL